MLVDVSITQLEKELSKERESRQELSAKVDELEVSMRTLLRDLWEQQYGNDYHSEKLKVDCSGRVLNFKFCAGHLPDDKEVLYKQDGKEGKDDDPTS